MTITADELARIRYRVPTTWAPTTAFDDAAVTAVWNREADTTATTTTAAALNQSWANVYKVTLILIDRMMAGLEGDPDSFSVGGEYSESRGAAINMLMATRAVVAKLLVEALATYAGTNAVVVVPIVRVNYNGR